MNRSRQQGVALITAVFLIVVLGGTAIAAALISTTQNVSSATGLNSPRAYYAARARLEKEIDRFINAGASCPASLPESLEPFDGFTVQLTDCVVVPDIEEGGAEYDVITLTVTAAKGSRDAGTRVRRQLRVQITRGL